MLRLRSRWAALKTIFIIFGTSVYVSCLQRFYAVDPQGAVVPRDRKLVLVFVLLSGDRWTPRELEDGLW